MKFRLSPVVVAVAATFPASFVALASDEPTAGTVVVTATRTATEISEILSDVTVVEREDIERNGGATLRELLSALPGVQVTTSGGRGSSGTISIHGSNSNHVLVLVDGLRVNSATLGTTAIEHVPLEQIERIEVLRGAASSLYGSDAIGGVIQIFTRGGSGAGGPTLSLSGGRYGTVNASAGYGKQSGATRFNILVAGEHSDGFGSIKEPNGGFFDPYNPDRDPYENQSVSAGLSHAVSERIELGAKVFRANAKKHFDAANCDAFFTQCTGDFDSRQRTVLQSVGADVRYRVSGWTSSLRLAQSEDRSLNWLFDPSTSTVSRDRFDTLQDQFAWENEFTVAGGKLLAVAEWRREEVSATKDFVETDRTTKSAVLGYQGWFGNHLLQASGRVDDIERLGAHRSGALAYGYRFAPGWQARASIATAYHAPTFNDLYWPLDQVNFFQGNPDLKSERALSREVGLSYDRHGLSGGLTLFQKKVTDLIDFASGGPPTFIGTMRNVSSATLKGATLHVADSVGPWTWRVNYDLLNARDDDTGRTLQRRAPRAGTVEVRRYFDTFDVGAQVEAIAKRYNNPSNTQTLSGYALLNLDANIELAKGWTLQGRVYNAFDRDYVQVRTTFPPTSDYVTQGRFLFVGVRYAPR